MGRCNYNNKYECDKKNCDECPIYFMTCNEEEFEKWKIRRSMVFQANGKFYTLEEVKDFWREHSFVCYNDRDFYEWLRNQTIFKEMK